MRNINILFLLSKTSKILGSWFRITAAWYGPCLKSIRFGSNPKDYRKICFNVIL